MEEPTKRAASEVNPGERIVHPTTGDVLTVKMVTEFRAPVQAGLPPSEPRLQFTFWEWPDTTYLLVSPYTAL